MSAIKNNPFKKYDGFKKLALQYIESKEYSLEVILAKCINKHELDVIDRIKVQKINWNPFVVLDNRKVYYQRELCWSQEDKMQFIESIYKGVDFGRILLRSRSYREIKELHENGHEVSFYDVVDGKQRLDAIVGFMRDYFVDLDHNLYSQLSKEAKIRFLNTDVIKTVFIKEDTPDKFVLEQFIRCNSSGVIMSNAHVEKLKQILA